MSLLDFFKGVELFSGFNDQELLVLEKSCRQEAFQFGESVIAAGEKSQGVYLVYSGRVRLFSHENKKEKSLGVSKVGDTFCEESLLNNGPSSYSVRTSGQTELLFFPSEVLLDLLGKNEKVRKFVTQYIALQFSGGLVGQFFSLKKSKVERSVYEKIIRRVGAKRIKAGQKILEQDLADDQRLYIIRSGQVAITREEDGKTFTLRQLAAGEVFGEKACLEYGVQPASAVAVKDSVVIVIPQDMAHLILKQNNAIRTVLQEQIQFLDKELDRQRKVASWHGVKALFSTEKSAGFRGKMIKRFPLVEQAEEMDCGAACLAMVCRYHKLNMSLGKLREMANVTTEGASMESLTRVGESLGFATKGVRCTYNALLGFDLPFIAHWEGYHFVVVYGVSKQYVWLADPGLGFRKLTRAEFEQGWAGHCLLFTATDSLSVQAGTATAWSRFVGYLKPMKKILRDLFLAALIMQLLGLVSPLIIQNILDKVIVHHNFSLLNMMIAGLGIAMVFSQLTEYLSAYLSNFMARKMDFTMMTHFCQHVLSLPVDFFARRKTGDIIARFQENETIRRFLTESSIGTILNAIMVTLYLIILFNYSVSLTFILIGFLVPIIALTLFATPKYKAYARKSFYAEAESESFLIETLSGAESIKSMAIEQTMRMKWEKKYIRALNIQFRSEMFTVAISGLSELLKAAATITILWYGASLVLKQQFTIGQMMAYNALVGSVMGPMLGLVGIWDEFQEALVSMERLGDVFELAPEQGKEDLSSRVILPDIDGDITCSDLYFRYETDGQGYILENINMTIPAGATVAIVGSSGSGKTTLAKLLVGLYKPTEGQISVCGYDMASLDLDYYRKKLGYVMQDNLLFAGTIAENIAMGAASLDQAQVIRTAKLADAHGFITAFPLGYEQVVGERGMGLSGGQIQRLCIARALYRDPKFLIFDEATSALDGESEHHIQTNMQQILQDRTAVIIAHRLSTVMGADQIYVLYNGQITEQGTHGDLIAKGGMYYQLFRQQITKKSSEI